MAGNDNLRANRRKHSESTERLKRIGRCWKASAENLWTLLTTKLRRSNVQTVVWKYPIALNSFGETQDFGETVVLVVYCTGLYWENGAYPTSIGLFGLLGYFVDLTELLVTKYTEKLVKFSCVPLQISKVSMRLSGGLVCIVSKRKDISQKRL